MRTVEEVIKEGLQAENWEKWYEEVRNEFNTYQATGRLDKQEKREVLKKIKRETEGKGAQSLEHALVWVNNAVRHQGNKITEEDMRNRKIIQEVTLTDEARSPDFNWGGVETWEAPLRAEGKEEEADWLLEMLAHARSEEAMKIEHFNLGRIYDPFKRIDLRKYEGRKKYYDYWKGIAEHYDDKMHHDFLNALKKDIGNEDVTIKVAGKEISMQDAIDDLLRIPAPEIVTSVDAITTSSLDKPLAVIDAFLERVSNEEDNVNWSVTQGMKTDDAGKVVDVVVEVGDKPASEMTSAEREKEAEEQSKLADEAEDMGRVVETITRSKIDPLLFFAIEEGKVALPFTAEDFKRFKFDTEFSKEMKKILMVIDPQVWKEFEEFIDELAESVEQAPNPPYYLPIKDLETEWEDVEDWIKTRKITKPGSEHWEKFFELLAAIVYVVPRRFSIKQEPV